MIDDEGEITQKIEPESFIIKIKGNNIFYKQFAHDMRKELEDIEVNLI